jgi:acyl-coenzyme A synthetase/AMP-(fatty) acid ligase
VANTQGNTVTPASLGRLFVSGREPGAPLAMRDDTILPFGGFAGDVAYQAAAIRDAGVTRGAVLSADPYRFLVGLFGLLHAGATAVLPPDGQPATLEDLRDRYDVLLCDEPPPTQCVALPIEEGRRGAAPIGAVDPAAAMLEFFTSGSTGAAKCIAKPLAMLDREIATLEALWGSGTDHHPVLATVPHRHIFGLTFHLLWPLATGLPFASHVDELWETLLARDLTGTVLVTSPAHLIRLGGLPRVPRGHVPARVFTAGAPLRAAQAREAEDVLGVFPTEVFGSTETGAIATRTQHAGDAPWTPLPGIHVHADETGRMIVHSPFGPGGAPFVTADRIEMTPAGAFHFLGRADRIAKIGGRRVSLARLEEELAALPSVSDAAVLVLDDLPERLVAAVVLTGAGRAELARLGAFRFNRELRRRLSRRLESAWLPKSWRFVEALPSGVMGKRRDADVRALFAQSPGRVP